MTLALVSACGGTDRAEELTQVACAKQSECCPGNESESECVDSKIDVFEPLFETDAIEIDEALLEDCIATVEALSCEEAGDYGGFPPVFLLCDPWYEGTLPDGESCGGEGLLGSLYADDECLSGNCVDGTCRPPSGPGEDCRGGACEEGYACSSGACEAELDQGEDCSEHGLCREPYECFRRAAGEDMRCEEPETIEVGEECGPGKRCELGNDQCRCPPGDEGCVNGVCGDRARCES